MTRILIITLLALVPVVLNAQWDRHASLSSITGKGFALSLSEGTKPIIYDVYTDSVDIWFYLFEYQGSETAPVLLDNALIQIHYSDGSISPSRTLHRNGQRYIEDKSNLLKTLIKKGGEVIITIKNKSIKYIFVTPKLNYWNG